MTSPSRIYTIAKAISLSYGLCFVTLVHTVFNRNTFREEICNFLEELAESPIAGQVDEVEGRITVTGKFADFILEFLYDKGF